MLEQYSAAVVRKLEHRNAELREALAKLQSSHEQMVESNQTLAMRVAQRTAALEAVNRELDSFSVAVSHDLRVPLVNIQGFAQLLTESAGGQLDVEGRDYLEQIIGATKRMSQLIEALLKFAQASPSELTLAEIDLERLLDEALASIRAGMDARNIQWRRRRLPLALGDATLLRQVFVNLISNAIKYTRTRDPAVIEIGTQGGRAGEVVVFIRDNGVGFDSRHAERLFGVFQRLHNPDEFEGTGIGLANVHRIVTRHGGAIWADAAVDRGATFFFSLPKARTARPGPLFRASGKLNRPSILREKPR